MATYNSNRHALKITIPAAKHLAEIIKAMKDANKPGVSRTRLVSDWIMAQRIPEHVHNGERRLHVAVDYCAQCAQIQTYHNGHCHVCGTALTHLTAIEQGEFIKLMHMVNVVQLRKDDQL